MIINTVKIVMSKKEKLSMASLWFTMYDIKHRVFDGSLYLIVYDIAKEEHEIQISNAEINERARLGTELTIKKYLK